MNHTFARPSAAMMFRGWLMRTWAEPDGRSIFVGVAGVVLFFLLGWLGGPRVFRFEYVPAHARPHATPEQFNIELEPEALLRPLEKQPDPFKFVETNPEAPENTPDKTPNFGAQNQQVAQETPTPDGRSDRPATEGKKDFESTQIVSGQLTRPIEELEAVPEVAPQEEIVSAPKAEKNPLPGFEKVEGEDKSAFGSNIAELPERSEAVPEKVEGEKIAPLIEGLTAVQPAIDPRKPRPRPQLVNPPQTRPAILQDNKFGTENIGNVAVDAKWSNYGAYLQRMIDSVQIQWERILIESKVYPPSGSSVTVKFVMNDEGRIARIVNVDSNSSESARRACVSAITDRAPYGQWTDDMKALLGTEQEMTFTFYYQ